MLAIRPGVAAQGIGTVKLRERLLADGQFLERRPRAK